MFVRHLVEKTAAMNTMCVVPVSCVNTVQSDVQLPVLLACQNKSLPGFKLLPEITSVARDSSAEVMKCNRKLTFSAKS